VLNDLDLSGYGKTSASYQGIASAMAKVRNQMRFRGWASKNPVRPQRLKALSNPALFGTPEGVP
jgi:hypothetical protein